MHPHVTTTALPLRPDPTPRETLPSFLSRLAAVNGEETRDFCVNMGFTLNQAISFDPYAVERVGELGGLGAEGLETLLSWTGVGQGTARMSFRGELFVSRALRNPVMRGCPICLREDAKARPNEPLQVMALRGDWQFREVTLCLRHSHVLVPLWEVARMFDRYDCGARLAEIAGQVVSGQLDRPRDTASDYDLWLDRRLENGSDPTWLASHSLFASATVCRLLGTELQRLERAGSDDPTVARRAAQAKGFEVLKQGEERLRAALDGLATQSEGPQLELKEAFGGLYEALCRLYIDESSFDPYRRILRDCILDTWPIAAGTVVLGVPLPERRLHSVSSAAKDIGVRPVLLERFLVEAGAFATNDPRPLNRKTFGAQQYRDLLAEIPALVGVHEMRTAMDATRNEFASLVEEGVLLPRTRDPQIKARWRLSDGLELVAELQATASTIPADDGSWESIQRCQKRTGLSVAAIIEAIRAGRLNVGCRDGVNGYTGFVVPRRDADRVADELLRLSNSKLLLATEFGRRVGLRNTDRLLAFFAAGHTSSRVVLHPKTGVEQTYMTEADTAAFHRRFMTNITISREFGEHRNTLLARLKAAGVVSFRANGETYGPIYLRADVEAAYRRAGSRVKDH